MDWLSWLSWLPGGVVLEQILKWTGVVLALLGAVLSTPHGTKHLFRDMREGLRRAVHGAWDFIGRIVPPWRRRVPATVVAPTAIASGEAFGTLTTSMYSWTPEADIETRVDQLKKRMDNLTAEMEARFERTFKSINDHNSELVRLEQLWRETKAEFMERLADNDKKSALVDAAGLPVIAAGVFLSGVPAELAVFPAVGWVFWLVGIGVLIWAFGKSRRGGAWKG
ncbi:hypothetical protein [Arthrobacter sp. Rue61a]|uniref:hypothetical protein n=1 Tax=Arthrobacter sp. Rue61a TaxID=1118963 RepID=UPI000150AE5A|nr:hypothetical protein [Arthrobacter sp. Rue61a]AFR34537.1 hypothetical protein ARUE_113p00290 [Arthrobacter sp. Rue61a]